MCVWEGNHGGSDIENWLPPATPKGGWGIPYLLLSLLGFQGEVAKEVDKLGSLPPISWKLRPD